VHARQNKAGKGKPSSLNAQYQIRPEWSLSCWRELLSEMVTDLYPGDMFHQRAKIIAAHVDQVFMVA